MGLRVLTPLDRQKALADANKKLRFYGAEQNIPALLEQVKATALVRLMIRAGIVNADEINAEVQVTAIEVLAAILDNCKAETKPKLLVSTDEQYKKVI